MVHDLVRLGVVVHGLGLRAEAESVPGVPDALLGLLPVVGDIVPLLIDGLLNDGFLIISKCKIVKTHEDLLKYSSNLLKLVTIMGMGRVMQRTPHMAQREPGKKDLHISN